MVRLKRTGVLCDRKQRPAVNLGKAHLLLVRQSFGKVCSVGTVMLILVNDDNVDGADALAGLLTQSGHDVKVAYDGAQALGLDVALAAEAAILDLNMPGMDGFETARCLRQTYGLKLRLIAFSGQDDDATRRRVEADFDAYLRKPASYAAISKALEA